MPDGPEGQPLSPPTPAMLFLPEVPSSPLLLDWAPPPATPRPSWAARARRDGFWTALALAVLIHAGLIAAALFFARQRLLRRDGFQPPILVLPIGWSGGSESSLSPGLRPLAEEENPILRPAPAEAFSSAAPARPRSLHPPGDAPPDAPEPSPRLPLQAQQGTQPDAPDHTIALGPADDAPPAVSFRTLPPALAQRATTDAEDPITGSGSAASTQPVMAPTGPAISSTDPSKPGNAGAPEGQPGGKGLTDGGAGAGQGRLGVPDGQPVPSTLNRPPVYPEIARRRSWHGTVLLELQIAADGKVAAARVARSSGHECLDDSALDAARTWQFTPAHQDGRPIALKVQREVTFIPAR